MKNLIIVAMVLIACLAISGDDKQLATIAYKDGLAQGWIDKIQEGACDIMGLSEQQEVINPDGSTNYVPRVVCVWQSYTNTVGEKWYATTFWADYQFTNASLSALETTMDKKIPKPFRDDVQCFNGNPIDGGLMP